MKGIDRPCLLRLSSLKPLSKAIQSSTRFILYKAANFSCRFKPEIWAKVAEEMAVPWRAAEAMHWQLGEKDMAHRAGVAPFPLSIVVDTPLGRRYSPSQSHSGNLSGSGPSSSRYDRLNRRSGLSLGRTITARRDSMPRSVPPPLNDGLKLAAIGGRGIGVPVGVGIGRGEQSQLLPSVAEMTTGVRPYSPPAYTMAMPTESGYTSSGPLLPVISMIGVGLRPDAKRVSPDIGDGTAGLCSP
jgi:hypothetical protein